MRTELADRQSDPHPSCTDRGSVKGAPRQQLQAPAGFKNSHREPGHSSLSQAGSSCKAGTSTARTWDGQPSPSGVTGRGGARGRAESTPVSQRSQHPSSRAPRRPSGVGPHGSGAPGPEARSQGQGKASGFRGSGPSHASAESKAQNARLNRKPTSQTRSPTASPTQAPLAPGPDTLGLLAPCECSPSM